MQGVIAAHDALQLGKFPDHPGDQVGLGQFRGPIHQLRVGADKPGYRTPPTAASRRTRSRWLAEPGMKRDLIQLRHAVLQPCLAIQVPEMPCIRETGPQHALIAGDDRCAAILRLYVRDETKPWGRLRRPASRSAKYRWFTRIETCMTSAGKPMKPASMRPSSGTGHSTSPATSSSRPGSSTTVSCFAEASASIPSGCGAFALRRPPARAARQAFPASPPGAHRERAGCMKAMALRQIA